jgi:hypothetical protein
MHFNNVHHAVVRGKSLGFGRVARGAAPRLTYGAVSSIISSEFMA